MLEWLFHKTLLLLTLSSLQIQAARAACVLSWEDEQFKRLLRQMMMNHSVFRARRARKCFCDAVYLAFFCLYMKVDMWRCMKGEHQLWNEAR